MLDQLLRPLRQRNTPAPELLPELLSENGRTKLGALSTQVQDVTAKAFAGLDQADLVVAHRVITSIIQKANELLADKGKL